MILHTLFHAIAFPVVILGLFKLVIYPLAVLFELRPRVEPAFESPTPTVSVIVPAYNEAVVIAGCIESILAAGYPRLELLVVDDGSTDATLAIARRYEHLPGVTVIAKSNGGKGSALNAGIARATGEVMLFVDADGIFTATTITEMLAGFRHRRVGAVCGNDQPVNLDRMQTRLLALMTHVGTGLTRRALALVGCLPIVAGNSGAFRASVVRQLGGFREDTVGEDLELTWRVQFAGYEVEFAPRAIVLAEVPSTVGALWKQRVRWGRGLIQAARHHRRLWWRPASSTFRWYLPINVISMAVMPILMLVALFLLPVLSVLGQSPVDGDLVNFVLWFGLITAVGSVTLSIVLDRAWSHLRFLPILPLWVPYSMMLSAVAARAMWLELSGAATSWNKLTRTGVVTVSAAGGSRPWPAPWPPPIAERGRVTNVP